VRNKFLEKHDPFLGSALLDHDYAAKRLDAAGAWTKASTG